jgi:hypothetical protein
MDCRISTVKAWGSLIVHAGLRPGCERARYVEHHCNLRTDAGFIRPYDFIANAINDSAKHGGDLFNSKACCHLCDRFDLGRTGCIHNIDARILFNTFSFHP